MAKDDELTEQLRNCTFSETDELKWLGTQSVV